MEGGVIIAIIIGWIALSVLAGFLARNKGGLPLVFSSLYPSLTFDRCACSLGRVAPYSGS